MLWNYFLVSIKIYSLRLFRVIRFSGVFSTTSDEEL